MASYRTAKPRIKIAVGAGVIIAALAIPGRLAVAHRWARRHGLGSILTVGTARLYDRSAINYPGPDRITGAG